MNQYELDGYIITEYLDGTSSKIIKTTPIVNETQTEPVLPQPTNQEIFDNQNMMLNVLFDIANA